MSRAPIVSLLLAAALPVICLAAEPSFVWSVRAGGAKYDKTRGLCTDRAGNVYMTGEYAETADFGKEKITSRGDYDFFVAKYSPEGECLWVRGGGGAKTDRGYSVAVDGQGNVFVTGHYQSADATFGDGPALPLRGDYDVFTAKYDASGKLLWIRTAGGEKYDYGHGIGVDGAGNCYVTGGIVGDATYGDKAVINPTGSHLFVVKYSPTGELVWVRESKGASANGQGIAVDAAGNSWSTGSTVGDAEFDGVTLKAAGKDLLVVKYSPDGKALWAAGGGGNSDGLGTGVGIDRQGNAYVGGMLKGTATFGSTTFKSAGDYDMFAAKFDPQGQPVWAHSGGGAETDYCLGIAADPDGGCYAVGEIVGATSFEGQSITSTGGRDLYVAHYDASGKPVSIRPGGSERDDLCYCIALDGKGSAYLSGAFNYTTKYGTTAPITSTGGNDIFLTKLKLR